MTVARLKNIDPLIVPLSSVLNVIYVTGFIANINPFFIVNDQFFKDIQPEHLFILLYSGFVVSLFFFYMQARDKKRRHR